MIRVLQSLRFWLPLTQNWVHEQIVNLPKNIETSIVAEKRTDDGYDSHLSPVILAEEFPLRWRIDQWLRASGLSTGKSSVKSMLHRIHPDVVHSHFGDLGWYDHEVVAATGAAHVVTFYGYDVNYLLQRRRYWADRYRKLFKTSATFLCEGPHMRSALIRMGAVPSSVLVHHLGVPVGSIPFGSKMWSGGELRVLIASSFGEKKGIPVALQALERLSRVVPLSVEIVGDASSDDRGSREKEKILAFLRRSDLRVRLHGFMSLADLRRMMAACHLLVVPSMTSSDGDTEGGAPVTLMEAAAVGIPVLSTDHCDIPEVIIDGKTGLLAPEGDVEALLRTLQEMIDRRDEWSRFAELGRARVEEEFDSAKQAVRLAALYERLAESR